MDSFLRDIQRESEKMHSDVSNLQRHYEQLAGYVQQYIQATTQEWARLVVDHPQSLLVIIETTQIVDEHGIAYTGEHEPIRMTGLSLASGKVWDRLICPIHSHNVVGQEYHGITLADVQDQPTLDDLREGIADRLLAGHHLIVFGLDWAYRALQTVRYHHWLDGATCLQNKCKERYGQFYSLSLETILSYQGIDKKREDLKNSQDRVQVLAQVVRNLAAGMPKQGQDEQEEEFNGLEDLSEHPF